MKFESIELTDSVRSTLPGKFIKISDGYVHYNLDGPEKGENIVLVHGFSSPIYTWNKIFEPLTQAGFRVLSYDLWGRGFSDRPIAKYNEDLFDRQLLELLNAVGFEGKQIHLMGLSMGGAISVVFTERHPTLVKSLTLFDPAGTKSELRGPPSILKVPGLGRILFTLIGNKSLIKGLPNNYYQPEKYPEITEKFIEQMQYKGFRRAILATSIDFPLQGLESSYEKVGHLSIPKQLFWGKQDKTIPFPASETVRKLIPNIIFHPIDECGHMPQYEHPEFVVSQIIEFIKKAK